MSKKYDFHIYSPRSSLHYIVVKKKNAHEIFAKGDDFLGLNSMVANTRNQRFYRVLANKSGEILIKCTNGKYPMARIGDILLFVGWAIGAPEGAAK